jgi:hypothetical protein
VHLTDPQSLKWHFGQRRRFAIVSREHSMFPLGKMAGSLQAAREAETDVYLLLVAARQLPQQFPWVVMKYVVVAELAFVDVVRDLSDRFMAQHSSHLDPERVSEIRALKKTFNRTLNGIEKRLRDHVRNLVSAHRKQQTVESVRETHSVLRDPAVPALFHSARTLLDALEDTPVWAWGYSSGNGVTGLLGSMIEVRKPSPHLIYGFEIRVGDRSGEVVSAEEVAFDSVTAAKEWAAAVGG